MPLRLDPDHPANINSLLDSRLRHPQPHHFALCAVLPSLFDTAIDRRTSISVGINAAKTIDT
jgi:hypothetical protein